MKDLNSIKEELKVLQENFNPSKTTYKVLEEVINKENSTHEVISVLAKIKGVNKYPDDLKKKFLEIMDDLKKLEQEEINVKFDKQKLLEKEKQEANTKELKDIIDSLEKDIKKNKKEDEQKEEVLECASENDKEEIDKVKGSLLFRVLLFLVFVTFVILGVVFFLY